MFTEVFEETRGKGQWTENYICSQELIDPLTSGSICKKEAILSICLPIHPRYIQI